MTGNILFVGSDKYGDQITSGDGLYIFKWDGVTSGPAGFTTLFHRLLDDPLGYMEPDLGLSSRYGIHVVVLHTTNYGRPEITILQEDTVLRTVTPAAPTGNYAGSAQPRSGRWTIIDKYERIHVANFIGADGTYKLYDSYSDDLGVTWEHVAISSFEYTWPNTAYRVFFSDDSDGNIYALAAMLTVGFRLYKSDDQGETWSLLESDTTYLCTEFAVMNDLFFRVIADMSSPYGIEIYKTADPTDWSASPVSTINGADAYTTGAYTGSAFHYDETYYYCDHVQQGPTGSIDSNIYRSSDGTTWTLVGTATGSSQLAPGYLVSNGAAPIRLFNTGYYMQHNLGDQIVRMNFFTSDDNGETWDVVDTPFQDASFVDEVDEGYYPWYSCPSGILFQSPLSTPPTHGLAPGTPLFDNGFPDGSFWHGGWFGIETPRLQKYFRHGQFVKHGTGFELKHNFIDHENYTFVSPLWTEFAAVTKAHIGVNQKAHLHQYYIKFPDADIDCEVIQLTDSHIERSER
jgi:hypothetical protein